MMRSRQRRGLWKGKEEHETCSRCKENGGTKNDEKTEIKVMLTANASKPESGRSSIRHGDDGRRSYGSRLMKRDTR